MSNTIKIKHGGTVPTTDDLQPYELGYCNKKLYISNGTNIVSLTGNQVTVINLRTGETSDSFVADHTFEEIKERYDISAIFLFFFGKVFVCVGSTGPFNFEFVQIGLTSLKNIEKFTVNSDNVWTKSTYSLI